MSSTTYQVERSAAAGFARADVSVSASVSGVAISGATRPWMGTTEIATVTKRHALNPSPRPEEAGP